MNIYIDKNGVQYFYYDYDSNMYFPMEDDKTVKIELCNHEWKEYIGFTDKFSYCVKCDERS